jgi:hypothetical protein
MNVYRITFHTKNFFQQHFNVTADKATHYHVLQNQKKIGEQSKLHQAIQMILDKTGANKELETLLTRSYFFKDSDPWYKCVGITFYDKESYGLKIEMKFNDNVEAAQ